MGSFLDKPITEKNTLRGSAAGLEYALSDMQGWRTEMEDAHTCATDIDGREGYHLFCVFDGHGGKLVSKYAGNNMLDLLLAQPKWKDHKSPEDIGEALRCAFLEADASMLRQQEWASGSDRSGSTAIAVVITPTHIVCANAGDSRAIMIKAGQVMDPLSYDHKPMLPSERERIENSGGQVSNGRVNGDLAVSRALGDFQYKTNNRLPPSKQAVSPEPEVKVIERVVASAGNPGDFGILICCDGIWDVMENPAAADFVVGLAKDGERDIGLMCEEILDECLNLGSKDNMSACLVAFPALQAEVAAGGGGVMGRRNRRQMEEAARIRNLPDPARPPNPYLNN